ncbi:flavin reductase family protein [Komagataeibacter rhaeticus]|nr:flavin reductase family protein [Komagataeibacter rhaeticus]
MRDAFISAMGHAAHSVSVVVTDGDAGRMGVTVSAVSSVSADPPMILACINRKSPAVAAICANGSMTINMLAATQHDISDVFSGRSQNSAHMILPVRSGHGAGNTAACS